MVFSDDPDFDVEKGFAGEGEQWEGEDEDLDLAVSAVQETCMFHVF